MRATSSRRDHPVDREYPRFGLIRVEADDQVLHDLRASMH
jgi:hypothetical protein